MALAGFGAGLAFAVFGMEDDAGRVGVFVDAVSPGGVVEVDKGSASGLSDHAHGFVEDVVAVADGGAEGVTGEAVGVDADEDRIGLLLMGKCVDVAADEGQVSERVLAEHLCTSGIPGEIPGLPSPPSRD